MWILFIIFLNQPQVTTSQVHFTSKYACNVAKVKLDKDSVDLLATPKKTFCFKK